MESKLTLSKEAMFCLVFSRNSPIVDRFENDEYKNVTGHLLKLSDESKFDAIAVLIVDDGDDANVLSCKQMRFDAAESTHLQYATTAVYEMAKEHGLNQVVPF